MVSVDEALGDWLKQVTKVAQMDRKDQEKITKAGAKVFAAKLKRQTEARHPNGEGTGGKYGHLSDQVGYKGPTLMASTMAQALSASARRRLWHAS